MAAEPKKLTVEEKYYASEVVQDSYKDLWGEGNIHAGFFPHLMDANAKVLNFAEGANEVKAND